MSGTGKIGNTDSWVFNIISDICAYAASGGEIILSREVNPSDLVPIKIISDLGSNNIVEPAVKKALLAMASMASAVGKEQITTVEKVQEEDETKYTITITKRK